MGIWEEDFNDVSSPQFRAVEWLVQIDPLSLCPGDENLEQRYILAVLYFQTGGEWWTRCSPMSAEVCDQGEAFLSGANECAWGGVNCDSSSRVTALHLDSNNLSGSLPSELGRLAYLVELDMDDNELTGSIPRILGQLSFLEIVDLDDNQLTGSIPEELYSVSSLEILDLDINQLTGTISTLIGNLVNLYYLQIDSNKFTGSIPSEVGTLTRLEYFSMTDIQIAEALPDSLCSRDTLLLYGDCEVCVVEDCCTACLAKETTP